MLPLRLLVREQVAPRYWHIGYFNVRLLYEEIVSFICSFTDRRDGV